MTTSQDERALQSVQWDVPVPAHHARDCPVTVTGSCDCSLPVPAERLLPGVTVVVCAHPARLTNNLLTRAFASICAQTLQPEQILVVNDKERRGAGWNRRTALQAVRTQRFAWLDSDDVMHPQHLARLNQVMDETGAVYVYSWFDGPDPLGHFGKPFNPCRPHHTTITALVDTALAQEVSFPDSSTDGRYSNEDWAFITGVSKLACERGLKMTHLAERTWVYDQAGQNSSGRPGQGDAR